METKQSTATEEHTSESTTSPRVYRPDVGSDSDNTPSAKTETSDKPVKEIGGRDGPDPTRFGDWEKNGRCIDF